MFTSREYSTSREVGEGNIWLKYRGAMTFITSWSGHNSVRAAWGNVKRISPMGALPPSLGDNHNQCPQSKRHQSHQPYFLCAISTIRILNLAKKAANDKTNVSGQLLYGQNYAQNEWFICFCYPRPTSRSKTNELTYFSIGNRTSVIDCLDLKACVIDALDFVPLGRPSIKDTSRL